MNESLKYLLTQMNKKKYPVSVRSADWVHGETITIPEFVKMIYEDRGLDYDESKNSLSDGKLLLYTKDLALSKAGKNYNAPLVVRYNPKAKFNTMATLVRSAKADHVKPPREVDVLHDLIYRVVSLQIPVTSGVKKARGYEGKQIIVEVGDVVKSGEKGEELPNYAVPVRCWVEDKFS